MVQFHATTICAVRRGPDDICIGGDGQVTMGETAIMKNGAKKVKKIYKDTAWTDFPAELRNRDKVILDKFKLKHSKEIDKIKDQKIKNIVLENLDKIQNGQRDFKF